MGQSQPIQIKEGPKASVAPSNVWIKVGLLSSCLHNNTLDTSTAAVVDLQLGTV